MPKEQEKKESEKQGTKSRNKCPKKKKKERDGGAAGHPNCPLERGEELQH